MGRTVKGGCAPDSTEHEAERIGSEAFLASLARSLDPLAFRNTDKRDKARRLRIVYARIRAAMSEYNRRERGDYDRIDLPGIQDKDIPW